MGKSTIPMAIFHSFLYVHQRVPIFNLLDDSISSMSKSPKSQDLKNQRNTLHIAACFNVEPQLLEAGKIDQVARNKMDTDGYTDIHEWYANKISISVIIGSFYGNSWRLRNTDHEWYGC